MTYKELLKVAEHYSVDVPRNTTGEVIFRILINNRFISKNFEGMDYHGVQMKDLGLSFYSEHCPKEDTVKIIEEDFQLDTINDSLQKLIKVFRGTSFVLESFQTKLGGHTTATVVSGPDKLYLREEEDGWLIIQERKNSDEQKAKTERAEDIF